MGTKKPDRILIFGNSGSGKSTLAKSLSQSRDLAHLDLDTLAWQETTPPVRQTLAESQQQIDVFMAKNENWVIEGCYTDLLELAVHAAEELIFMNLALEECQANAKRRPWEPHKYESKEAQDQNLAMLLDWISQYPHRQDTFSLVAHLAFYERFEGTKTMIESNEDSKKLGD